MEDPLLFISPLLHGSDEVVDHLVLQGKRIPLNNYHSSSSSSSYPSSSSSSYPSSSSPSAAAKIFPSIASSSSSAASIVPAVLSSSSSPSSSYSSSLISTPTSSPPLWSPRLPSSIFHSDSSDEEEVSISSKSSIPLQVRPSPLSASSSSSSSSSPSSLCPRLKCQSVDVLVVGNGPSGMALSFMLSGNAPVYSGGINAAPHPNLALHQRLLAAGKDGSTSLLEQDLASLSNGLEGRSTNGVELLFDTLFHPNIDAEFHQRTRLEWQQRPDLAISHVVVGAGEPGGSWQSMHNSMVTLSYGDWMELPGYSLSRYAKEDGLQELLVSEAGSSAPPVDTSSERVQRYLIARYYQDYPKKTGISSNMLNHARVTSVMPMKEACEQGLCACGLLSTFRRFPFLARLLRCGCADCLKYKWFVRIERRDPRNPDKMEQICVRTNQVVLASGMFDVPKKLGFPGEDFSFVFHSVKDLDALERKITTESLRSVEGPGGETGGDPGAPWVVVVGSGLSAADSVLHLRSQGKNVMHIYHDKKGTSPLARFPRSSYPEYAALYRLMKAKAVDEDAATHSLYTPLPDAEILGVTKQGQITIRDHQGVIQRHKISRVLVLIGSQPLLSFMENGITADALAEFDPMTFQVRGHDGLYIVGSLTGSKFVRFGLGTTLGVAQSLVRQKVTGTLGGPQREQIKGQAEGEGHLDKKRKT